ncbi:hypothetical protein VU677_06000 [Hafnia paralvei]|uniref:hypothetical protein n=1 Tax=Hafnia paralvei TaxID=546367 RepID=UPI00300D8386
MATVSINVCIPVILEAASVLAVLVPHETQLACQDTARLHPVGNGTKTAHQTQVFVMQL